MVVPLCGDSDPGTVEGGTGEIDGGFAGGA